VAKIGQGAHDPVIAPAGILPSHADNQLLDVVVYLRSANLSTCLGTIELLGHQFPVPTEDRVRLCGIRHVLKRFPTEPVTNLGERLFLGVGKQQATVNLLPENAVFGNQILIAKQ
jgi:hypothetical protein